MKPVVLWAPRILTIVFALFLTLFAADAFSEAGFWPTVLALLMHLIPTMLVLMILALSWRKEWIGTVLFSALAFVYVATSWGRFPFTVYVAIAGPMMLAAVLFLRSWLLRTRGPDQLAPGT